MATKLYLHDATTVNTGTLPSSTHSAQTSDPSATPPPTHLTQRSMSQLIGNLQASLVATTDATVTASAIHMGMWESPPLSAQTLPTGTWTLSFASDENNAASNYQTTFTLYVWRPSTGAVVGSLLYDAGALATEPGTAETAATLTTGSLSGIAVLDGDILVCEVWRGSVAQGGATARTNTLFYDGTTEASTSTCASFLECNAAAPLLFLSPLPQPPQPGGKTWARRHHRKQQLTPPMESALSAMLDSASQPSPTHSTTSPLTWTHTNHGQILLVAVTTFTGSSNLCTGVTYGGVNVPFQVFVQSDNDVFGGLALYALSSAGLPTGANTVSVSFTGAGDTAAFAMSFLNANQLGTVATAYGSSAAASVTVSPTTAGRLIADFVATGTGVTSATAPNVLKGAIVAGTSGGTGNSAMGTDPSTGSAVSPHWVVSSDEWCMIAAEVYLGYAPLVIAFHPLPGALPGAAYSNALTATGGSGGYTWSVSSGSLPGWASLSAGGVITGTPGGGDVGSTTFTLKVTDSASETQTEQFTLWVLSTRCISALSGTDSTACFVDQTGTPMLMFCDSAWSMVYRAGASGGQTWQQDMDQYVSTRAGQGYTAVQCNLMPNNEYVASADQTWDGIYPFNSTTDPSSGLNATYWARVDYLVASCASHGMTFFMNLLMGEDISSGCAAAWTSTQQNAFGAAVANRYLDNPNVIWMINDDDGVGLAEMQAILAGARSTGDNNPIAAEQQTECTSRTIMLSGAATDGATLPPLYNWVYSYNADYLGIEIAYQESSPIPVLRGDGYYYGEGLASGKEDLTARHMLWWALASGSRGFSGGVGDGQWIFGTGWASELTQGAEETGTTGDYQGHVFPAVAAFWKALPGWQKLMPDTASAFITAGRGTRATAYSPGLGSGTSYDASTGTDNYVAGSIAADGSLAVIYFSRTAASTITVNTALLAGGYTAQWVDPCTCAVTSATPGSTYTKPSGANSAGGTLDHDWVLVLGPALSSGVSGAAALSGTGSLTAQPVVAFKPAAALSGTGTLTAAGVLGIPAAAALSGTGSLTAQPVVAFKPAAALSGTGTLTAQPVVAFAAAAALSGTGTLTAAGVLGIWPAAALSGTGVLTATATVAFPAAAALSGTGVLTASAAVGGSGNQTPAAALSGLGVLGAAAVLNIPAAAALSGTGSLTAGAVLNIPAAAALSGTGTLTAAGVLALLPHAALSGTGVLTAAAVATVPAAAALAGLGTLAAAAVTGARPAAALSGTGLLGAAGAVALAAVAALSGTGVLTAAGLVTVPLTYGNAATVAAAAPAATPAPASAGSADPVSTGAPGAHPV